MHELRDELLTHLLGALALTQQNSGRTPPEMNEETIPFLHLEKFDSHNGVEVEVILSELVGVEIDEIPFHEGRRGSREYCVREIVDAIVEKYGSAIATARDKSRNELVAN